GPRARRRCAGPDPPAGHRDRVRLRGEQRAPAGGDPRSGAASAAQPPPGAGPNRGRVPVRLRGLRRAQAAERYGRQRPHRLLRYPPPVPPRLDGLRRLRRRVPRPPHQPQRRPPHRIQAPLLSGAHATYSTSPGRSGEVRPIATSPTSTTASRTRRIASPRIRTPTRRTTRRSSEAAAGPACTATTSRPRAAGRQARRTISLMAGSRYARAASSQPTTRVVTSP